MWDGVVVEDGARISCSIVANEARILKGAVVNKSCLVSFRVVIGPDVHLPASTKLTVCTDTEEELTEVFHIEIFLAIMASVFLRYLADFFRPWGFGVVLGGRGSF